MPKLTISAKESNCLPIADIFPRRRAKKPSKKSKKAANHNTWCTEAMLIRGRSDRNTCPIAKYPHAKLSKVKVLGSALNKTANSNLLMGKRTKRVQTSFISYGGRLAMPWVDLRGLRQDKYLFMNALYELFVVATREVCSTYASEK